MKLAILGGGGVRALMLTRSLVRKATALGIDQIAFMDIDERKLRIFGSMCLKAAEILDSRVKVTFSADAAETVRDADFVITTIRVGGDSARILDERIAVSHKVIGQETTGAGGFAMALRTIPVMADYCRLIRQHAKPGVTVFNFTNPAGLVTQAMHDLGYDFVHGICDAPSSFMAQVARLYGAKLRDLELVVFGLNHLSYFLSIKLHGKEMVPEILNNPRLYTDTDMRYLEPRLAKSLGMILHEYMYYFYYREKAEQNLQRTKVLRSEAIAEINSAMIDELDGIDIAGEFEKALAVYARHTYRRESTYMSTESGILREEGLIHPFSLYDDDESYAGVALAYIEAKITGIPGEMVLCLPNGGTVDWLEASDIVEVSCDIGSFGARPKKCRIELPETCRNLVTTVKLYERLAVEAILKKDREMAVFSLMVHPLVNSYTLADELISDYFKAHHEYVRDWKQTIH